MYATISLPLLNLTNTHFLLAELGFLGFLIKVFNTTPFSMGLPLRGFLGALTFLWGPFKCICSSVLPLIHRLSVGFELIFINDTRKPWYYFKTCEQHLVVLLKDRRRHFHWLSKHRNSYIDKPNKLEKNPWKTIIQIQHLPAFLLEFINCDVNRKTFCNIEVIFDDKSFRLLQDDCDYLFFNRLITWRRK